MLALVFLAVQYAVDWIDVDRYEAADGDAGGTDSGGGGGGSAGLKFGTAAVDGRGRPVSAEPLYGSVDQLYVNDEGHLVRVDSDSDADYADESESDEAGIPSRSHVAEERGETARVHAASLGADLHGYETGLAASSAAARRNSRHCLHEREVVQIKGHLQRSHARIVRLRSDLRSVEDDLTLLSSAAASMRAAARIRVVRGESRMIEQEILLCESEASMLEAAGVCSLPKGISVMMMTMMTD